MAGMFEGYPGWHGTILTIRFNPGHPGSKEGRIGAGMVV